MPPDFRLLRLILLDSYSPGGEVILDLSDGAILTGDNGSGKTSLLSLISIFYGENPGRCTSGSSTFADFYLPHSTSYVIFEYQRHDVTCMVVLYAVGESTFNYRFIRAAYDLSLFTVDGDGATLVEPTSLSKNIKLARVLCSSVLVLSEYRHVIQGHTTGGKSGAENRALVAEYAFTSKGNKLLHIDKIVSGMFTRQANFEEFLRVIVDYISDEGNAPISVSGEREQYAYWPAQFAAYNVVMQHAELMAEVDLIDTQLNANRNELSCLHGKLIVLSQHYIVQFSELQAKKARMNVSRSEEQTQFNARFQTLQAEESKCSAEAGEAESRVKAINTKEKECAAEAISEKAALVDNIQQSRVQLASLLDRKEILLGESFKIEQKYQLIALAIQQAQLELVEQINLDIERIRLEYAPLLSDNRVKLQTAVDALQVAAESKLTGINVERDQALSQVAHCSAVVANPPSDAVAVEALEKKRKDKESLHEEVRAAQHERRALEVQKTQTVQAFTDQEEVLRRLRLRAKEIDTQIQAHLSHLNPDHDSLLHFLRTNKPAWTDDIAKVIREDVLTLRGLAPSLTDDVATLYGVDLDLSHIDSTLCADEKALQEAIEASNTEQSLISQNVREAEQQLEQCNSRRHDADTALTRHDANIAALLNREKTLNAEESTARQMVESSKRQAKQEAEQQLEIEKNKVDACNQQIQYARDTLATERRDCVAHHEALDKSLTKRQNDAIGERRSTVQTAEFAKQAQLRQIDSEKSQALSDNGVDTLMLGNLDAELTKLNRDIRHAENWITPVNAWRFWRETELVKREQYADTAINQRHQQQEAHQSKNNLLKQWTTKQTELNNATNALDGQINEIERNQSQIQSKILQLSDYKADETILLQPLDIAWTLGGLFGLCLSQLLSRKTLTGELVTRIRKIKASFSNVQGSPTEQYFSTTRADVDPDDSNPAAWVKPLHDWFAREHASVRHVLMMQAQNYGGLIADFHDKLALFHKEVGRFNTDIQKSLNQTRAFRCITSITIHFDSALEQLKYWPDVKQFIAIRQAWDASGQEMPPPEFADSLKKLISHWEVKEGIRAERRKLINIRGEVVENGNFKPFRTTADLGNVSSNGLSYLILCTIFVAFVRKIRGSANVQILWSVDELLDLDSRNIYDLLAMLNENNIRLFSACPEANVEILNRFSKIYRVQRTGNKPEIVSIVANLSGVSDV